MCHLRIPQIHNLITPCPDLPSPAVQAVPSTYGTILGHPSGQYKTKLWTVWRGWKPTLAHLIP